MFLNSPALLGHTSPLLPTWHYRHFFIHKVSFRKQHFTHYLQACACTHAHTETSKEQHDIAIFSPYFFFFIKKQKIHLSHQGNIKEQKYAKKDAASKTTGTQFPVGRRRKKKKHANLRAYQPTRAQEEIQRVNKFMENIQPQKWPESPLPLLTPTCTDRRRGYWGTGDSRSWGGSGSSHLGEREALQMTESKWHSERCLECGTGGQVEEG